MSTTCLQGQDMLTWHVQAPLHKSQYDSLQEISMSLHWANTAQNIINLFLKIMFALKYPKNTCFNFQNEIIGVYMYGA